MDPSPGNMAPSWPVAMAHGTRNTTNPMIHQPNADGPAPWITAALVMNSTMATKIATMSNVVSTRGSMPPATRSEISEPESESVVMATLLGSRWGPDLGRADPRRAGSDLGEVTPAIFALAESRGYPSWLAFTRLMRAQVPTLAAPARCRAGAAVSVPHRRSTNGWGVPSGPSDHVK